VRTATVTTVTYVVRGFGDNGLRKNVPNASELLLTNSHERLLFTINGMCRSIPIIGVARRRFLTERALVRPSVVRTIVFVVTGRHLLPFVRRPRINVPTCYRAARLTRHFHYRHAAPVPTPTPISIGRVLLNRSSHRHSSDTRLISRVWVAFDLLLHTVLGHWFYFRTLLYACYTISSKIKNRRTKFPDNELGTIYFCR